MSITTKSSGPTVSGNEPIAIISMSCRFPKANNPEQFWNVLENGVDTVSEIPKQRWDLERYYDPDPNAQGKTYQRHAALLDDLHSFDPFFFNISPVEANEMNPSQKLMLELTWELIESTNIQPKNITGKRVGVYVGNIWSDFEHHRKHINAKTTLHSAVGQSSNVIANRVSYTFGFYGPSLVVDTGCSSSLVALHLAWQALHDGSIEMAMVGGINHILDPDQWLLLTKFGGLSKKGKCSTFDADADGFVRGEGAGCILLKRLSDAERDNDKILAVIKGSAMNNNGYNINLPATSIKGQLEVLETAYKNSGIKPSDVHYIEAHGTGTKLGDPTETKALGQFFSNGRNGNPLHIGSVKTNIGHQEAAAGIAGLIKVVLAMQKKKLPPNINFKTPNPEIPFEELKLKVQDKVTPWPVKNGEPFKAGINSFGWGGTNAHTVIEEYRPKQEILKEIPTRSKYVLALSAKSDSALKDYMKLYEKSFKDAETDDKQFAKICASTSILKSEFNYRNFWIAENKESLLNQFAEDLANGVELNPVKDCKKVVFVFPGQGSQWIGMGRDLYKKEKVFRQVIDECDEHILRFGGWSLKGQIFAQDQTSRLNEINVIQPFLFAIQVALAKLWMSWGVVPDMVVGHSMGEVAGAYIAGGISLRDAAKIICTRSILMKTVSGKGGAMAVTELSYSAAAEFIKKFPGLSLAVSNSPKSTVLAGMEDQIEEALLLIEKDNLFCRRVKVDVASHSQQMDAIKEELRNQLIDVKPLEPAIPIFSTVKNRQITGTELNNDYWVSNLRGTVHFAGVVDQLINSDHNIFIEVSPHPVLSVPIKECAEAVNKELIIIPSTLRDKDEEEELLKNLGSLYTQGFMVDWPKFYNVSTVPALEGIAYPFQREIFQPETLEHSANHTSNSKGLLGHQILLASVSKEKYWETNVSLDRYPFLKGHKVDSRVVFPGTGYLELILEAGKELLGSNFIVSSLELKKALVLEESKNKELQVKFQETQKETYDFTIFLKSFDEHQQVIWDVLAMGSLTKDESCDNSYTSDERKASAVRVDITGQYFYEEVKKLGVQYEDSFQAISSIGIENKNLYTLLEPDKIVTANKDYVLHPALADCCMQTLFGLQDEINQLPFKDKSTFLTKIINFKLYQKLENFNSLRVVTNIKGFESNDHSATITGEVCLLDSEERLVFKAETVECKIIDASILREEENFTKDWYYKVNWIKKDNRSIGETSSDKNWLVVGNGSRFDHLFINGLLGKAKSISYLIQASQPVGLIDENKNVAYYSYDSISDIQSIIREINEIKQIDCIVNLYSLSELAKIEITGNQLQQSVEDQVMTIKALVEAVKQEGGKLPQMYCFTNGAVKSVQSDASINLAAASMWGFFRVLANEVPEINCTRIDLSHTISPDEVTSASVKLLAESPIDREWSIRGNEIYVSRLTTQSVGGSYDTPEFDSNGTYLITGFGGIASWFLEWMSKHGARNFSLVSRSGKISESLQQRLQELAKAGVKAEVRKADVGSLEEMTALFDNLKKEKRTIKGVIHAAGVIEAKAIADLEIKDLTDTLTPKIMGAWNLHLLTQDMPLDTFVLFSSASSLIGLSGQSAYVTANSFLDGLSHFRQMKGLPALCINWGVVKDAGMVAKSAHLEKYSEAEGFVSIMMNDAIARLERIFCKNYSQMGIFRINSSKMCNYYSALAKTGYFSEFSEKESREETWESDILETIQNSTDIAGKRKVVEQFLIQQVAKIIKAPVSKIKNEMTFKALGVDSLMAVQLRNVIEKKIGKRYLVTEFWAHPTIREFTDHVLQTLGAEAVSQSNHVNPWVVVPKKNESAKFKLICFHDAGGNASLYHEWAGKLSEKIELNIIELPGRGKNACKDIQDYDSLISTLLKMVDELTDRPFILLGHSMGGALAFDLCKRLNNIGKIASLLLVSSTPGLRDFNRAIINSNMTEADLLNYFPHLASQKENDLESYKYLVNLLIHDLKLLKDFKYELTDILDIPIIGLSGNEDNTVSKTDMEKWQLETQKGYKLFVRNGGHRFIENDSEFVTGLINKEIDTLHLN